MKGLLVKDLELGTVYRCLLSGNSMLIFSKNEKDQTASGWYYNGETYMVASIQDGQLMPFPQQSTFPLV